MTIPSNALDALPTPCLVVDLEIADRNIEQAADRFRNGRVSLRPHFKAHKCTRLLRRQLEAGGCSGVTCQTSWEALGLARAGFDNILIANQVADHHALAEVGQAARRARISVAVDCLEHVAMLGQVIRDHDVSLGVVIELDVGIGRCGLAVNSDQLIPIAAAVAQMENLELVGLQAYEGHAVLREDRMLRKTMVWQAAAQADYERRRLEAAGFDVSVISGGGTGTLDLAHETGVLTEIQAGSYALMDGRYGSLDISFENALLCIATVISRRSPEAGVLNVGLKELTVEYGMPQAVTSGLKVIALSDEHARIAVSSTSDLSVGDKVVLIPAHIDPAINLHDVLFVWDGSGDFQRWPVDGRRKLDEALGVPEATHT